MARLFCILCVLVALAAPATAGVVRIPQRPTGGSTQPRNYYICDAKVADLDAITGMVAGETAFCSDTKASYFYSGSAWQETLSPANALLFVATADKVYGNTSGTPTSIVPTTGIGSITLPAGFLTAGRSFRLILRGYITNTGTPNFTIAMKVGSTTVYAPGAIAMTAITGTRGFELFAVYTCRTTGGSGTLMGYARWSHGTNISSAASWDHAAYVTSNTIDTTAALQIDVLATWGTTDPANTLTAQICTLEVLN